MSLITPQVLSTPCRGCGELLGIHLGGTRYEVPHRITFNLRGVFHEPCAQAATEDE